MSLKIAMVARNPFALHRARAQFAALYGEDILAVDGLQGACRIRMNDGTVIRLLSESDWRRGSYCRESFDQIFRVGAEPLGIDFRLELEECLAGSCVPEEWKWQDWEGEL